MICAWMDTSSDAMGSSATSSSGSMDSARAMATRWRMPPDSSGGYLSRYVGSRPTYLSWNSASARRVPRFGRMWWMAMGSAMMSATVMC